MKCLSVIAVSLCVMAVGGDAKNEDDMKSVDSTFVRPAAVAGAFYPGSPAELMKTMAAYFHAAPKPQISSKPIAIISPHAGYTYSGQIAARGYKILEGEEFRTVIVISPSHTAYFPGVSAFGGKAYATPLGDVPIDRELTDKIIAASDLIKLSPQGHLQTGGRFEHALEVQLPFLQLTLGKFSLVALVMGDQDPRTCADLGRAIATAIGKGDDILIVASSDLSHFHDSGTAERLDAVARGDIERLDYRGLLENLAAKKTEACGGGPMVSAMIASEALGADSASITGFGDSGDVTGDKTGVVGYVSAVIYRSQQTGDKEKIYEIEIEPEKENVDSGAGFGLSESDKKLLLSVARQSIETYLSQTEPVLPDCKAGPLALPLGAFVTLHEHGELRGCIGTFHPDGPLYKVVAMMARQAAFADYRFQPVTAGELRDIDIEISVLTPMKRVFSPDEVVVGRDGLYIKKGIRAGVLLPQVPVEQGWDHDTFLDHTCLKAGLPTGSWRDGKTELYVFQAEIFGERPAETSNSMGR